MVTRVVPAEPISRPVTAPRQVLRPEDAIRHLAADLEKVSSVVGQTAALGFKMVELSQSLSKVEPAVIEAASSLAASNGKLEETAHRVLAAVEIMEMAQRQSMESLNKRMNTLVGLIYWALALGSCAMTGSIIAAFAYFTHIH